jgi:MarR family transcriptional regulator, lower aerobic nicotinate degradation pathway regulator
MCYPRHMTAARTPAALRRRPTYALARLAAASRRRCAKHLATVGLGQHQHAILCCLAEFGPQMQKDTAVRLGIDSGDIVAFVDDLQDAGLVERRRDERDRRRQILTLTPAGQQALAEAERQLDRATRETFQPLTVAERAQLHQLMARVLAHEEPGSWPVANR